MHRRVLAVPLLASLACGGQRSQGVPVPAMPVVQSSATPVSAIPATPPPGDVATMLAEISPQQLQATLTQLVGFGTRHTLSDTRSETRGIGAARRWIKAEMERGAQASGRAGDLAMRVEFDVHTLPPDGKRVDVEVEVVNVVAVLPGIDPVARERRYYVVAHYDSRVGDVMDRQSDSPGANDNGSGTALVIELARVLARYHFDATLVFMVTAGEEQGLLGARGHAEAARRGGVRIAGVLNNDIVGDPGDPRGGADHRTGIRVFSEGLPAPLGDKELAAARQVSGLGEAPSRQLARYVAEVGARQGLAVRPVLVFRPDRFLRGGDHTAFSDLGFPAIRFTEVAEKYDRQHQEVRVVEGRQYGDRLEHVDVAYLAEVARLNAAALVHLARAPSGPGKVELMADALSIDTTLRWDASPEADVAGYEVLRRATTAPDWEYAHDLGRATVATLPYSKDDWLFAVRSYDNQGYRSPAVFPTLAK